MFRLFELSQTQATLFLFLSFWEEKTFFISFSPSQSYLRSTHLVDYASSFFEVWELKVEVGWALTKSLIRVAKSLVGGRRGRKNISSVVYPISPWNRVVKKTFSEERKKSGELICLMGGALAPAFAVFLFQTLPGFIPRTGG